MNQTQMTRIGKKLKKLRTKMGISQHTLARRAGLSQSHICKIELGETPLTEKYSLTLGKLFKIKSF
jgi:transcriptional regulator with XRE-family HTH domain